MRGVDDLVGRKFGRLFVVEEGERKIDSDGRHRTSVKCICDCGATVTVRATRVRNGKTLSCGCIQKENLAMRNSIHQSCQTRLYRIWCAMKTRCDNPRVIQCTFLSLPMGSTCLLIAPIQKTLKRIFSSLS